MSWRAGSALGMGGRRCNGADGDGAARLARQDIVVPSQVVRGACRASAEPAGASRGETGGGIERTRRGLPSPGRRGTDAVREERDKVNGIFVNNSKLKIQFTEFNFPPTSWAQMKNF